MTDFAGDETLSTVIDTEAGPSASGGGTPDITESVEAKVKEPLTLRDELSKAFKDDAAKTAARVVKADADPKAEKPEATADAAKVETPKVDARKEATAPAAKTDADAPEATTEAKPEEKGDSAKFQEPPKKFLPDAREHWRNVPRSVRRDIDAMVREQEATETRYKAANDRYETIRDFDELAKSNGRELRDSLTRVHQIETMLQSNPVAGINAILMEVGPRKADGQPVSLFEMAQFIVEKGPQGYQQMMQQGQPQQRQRPAEDPRVSQLQQQLQQMQEQTLAAQVIEPFKAEAEHSRYNELQEDIAFFLQSGKISQSLSPYDRLAAAYDMAVRINPASHDEERSARVDDGPDQERRAGEDFSGPKSIKSSPGSVTETVSDQGKSGESVADSIRSEIRRMNRK